MSDYDKRYNVHANMVSHYTDDPAEALRLYRRGEEAFKSRKCRYPPFINEGYAEDRDYMVPTSSGGSEFYGIEITRRTLGPVLPSTLEFRAQRAAVQTLIQKLKGTK